MSGSQQLLLGTGAGGAVAATYIEDVFSTWLYTGNGSTQTITNGIDLSTKGGLVWLKGRSGGDSNVLYDTNRGVTSQISSNSTDAAQNQFPFELTDFNSNGFTIGSGNTVNRNGSTYASWTFRKQPKFFDVVTYTGNGSSNRTISHNLGSTPGFVIIKNIDQTGNWMCWHNSFAATDYIALNTTGAKNYAGTLTDIYKGVSSTTVTIGSNAVVNNNSYNYVMYVFAHDAGGFGLTGTDNVISCGSYTGNGSSTGPTVTLGYEPQWLMIKRATGGSGNWIMYDNMRGMPMPSVEWADLLANSSAAENAASTTDYSALTATGFQIRNALAGVNNSGDTYIYIAIRRGPMKTPTSGTSVFAPVTQTGNTTITTNFPVDTVIDGIRNSASGSSTTDRLRGSSTNFFNVLKTYSTSAETSGSGAGFGFDNNTGYAINGMYGGTTQTVMWNFRRAPGFFDVVCYTGNGVARTINHNLGVAPELMIIKSRSSGSSGWPVYAAAPGPTQFAYLDDTGGFSANSTAWNDTAPTASVFTVGTGSLMNTNSVTYVTYLFASCPGVSKVGSYTGTGALQTVNCGFTGGARFVLIKRTDSTGDWFVYDSARGISSGNDPYLLLNSTAAEVTGTNYVDTTSVGFQVTAAAPAGLNANGGTFVFLAIS